MVSKKALKFAQKTVSGPSKKKKVSFGPLEESFTHLNKYIFCIIDEVLVEPRAKYHIPNFAKLRAPTADEKPHHVHGWEVAIYLKAIYANLQFTVHPFLGEFFTPCMWLPSS